MELGLHGNWVSWWSVPSGKVSKTSIGPAGQFFPSMVTFWFNHMFTLWTSLNQYISIIYIYIFLTFLLYIFKYIYMYKNTLNTWLYHPGCTENAEQLEYIVSGKRLLKPFWDLSYIYIYLYVYIYFTRWSFVLYIGWLLSWKLQPSQAPCGSTSVSVGFGKDSPSDGRGAGVAVGGWGASSCWSLL